ncbi:MAG: CRISPR-associated protein Cas4 [Desulfomonile sp.]|jgi:CRISPR-associated exonuclease Cas4
MFSEEDLLPLSSLQHLLFCNRRAALVLLEGIWDENRFTAVGRLVHDRVHTAETESRNDIRISRGLFLRSLRLGLTGKTDVVEFHRIQESCDLELQGQGLKTGVILPATQGLWRPFPVEYKSGYLRHEEGYEIQLCAQAMCLEEMLEVQIAEGALFYSKTGRRMEIAFNDDLRKRTEESARRLHEIVRSGVTPTAQYEKKCDKCSLISMCMPKTTGTKKSVRSYWEKALE